MGQFNPFVGATSGGGGTGTTNYQELTNKPKINGIQLNGNKTMVDLGVFYGASLNASINTSTYIMTLQLKDQQGNILGTPQTIDLPLETVVVGGRYDDQTKRVILTLQNGNTINFSIADLIDGLQAEITSENRLDADLINDTTSINKFVTEAEKTNWNNKVDQISGKGLSTNDYTTTDKNKLAGIEAQANKTIVDNALNNSSTNPVQNKIIKRALDNKQDSLTMAQLAAVNSGITAERLETDESNISKAGAALIELIDSGAKNKLSIGAPTSVPTGLTCVRNDDGTYAVSGTLTSANSISFNISAIEGNLVLSGCPEGGGDNSYLLRITKSGSQVVGSVDTGNGSDIFTMEGTGYALNIRFAAGTYTNVIFKPMICTKAAWDISQSYQPYRPSYQELYEIVLALQGGNY